MNLASLALRRTMAQGNSRSPNRVSTIERYGLAVLSVSVALGVALLLDRLHFRGLASPFLLALAVAAWYGGTGAAVLALLLSCISFAYFFLGPFHTLFIAFASFAALVIWFCIVRRHVERTLRRSEAYLAEAQQLSHTGSFGWDVSSGRIYWSQETFRIFEYDPTTEPTLQLVLHRTHPEDRTKVEKMIDGVPEGKEFDFEHRLLMPDGSVKYVRVVGRPSNDASGCFEFVGAVTDITARKRAEEELYQKEVSLRQVQTELAHVNRVTTMGELAASIAHEVNQPLAGIVTNANSSLRWLAGDSPNLAEAREATRRIIRDGNRAGEVVSRMRALFKKASTVKERFDINAAIEEVVVLTQSEVRKNKVAIRMELAANLPPVVGDRVQIQQVLMNLTLNAFEAMSTVESRDRDLVIRTQRDESDQVRVALQDSGIGFDPKNVERIFHAFHTTKPGGLGMGLSISRSIVEAHGGRLWAKANSPRGAAFEFTVPIREESRRT
jgi:PAS domain S-box-containing protein